MEQFKHILVVDDDRVMRDVVAEILQDEGYGVECVANGRLALLAIDHHRPGLILLDLRMDDGDGSYVIQALDRLRIRIPIVLMSAEENVAAMSRSLEVETFLAKPFSLSCLLKVTGQFLQRVA